MDRRDHPRSRGVYIQPPGRLEISEGSSPLARGLPEALRPHLDHAGIIPARAGFTSPCRRPSPPRADHPRSRGVYSLAPSQDWRPTGSSPLARGLRDDAPAALAAARIIPARAGFTDWGSPTSRTQSDHPRSRGVYGWAAGKGYRGSGSSPLARGLRAVSGLSLAGTRIIPARAGFTTEASSTSAGCGDHPRSRGVYSRWTPTPPSRAGSSPLARGLPRPARRGAGVPGIIPARAGFTS